MSLTKRKTKINLGREYRDPRNAKHRVSFWMDGDLLGGLKKRAVEAGVEYQTYTLKILRDVVMDAGSLEGRL